MGVDTLNIGEYVLREQAVKPVELMKPVSVSSTIGKPMLTPIITLTQSNKERKADKRKQYLIRRKIQRKDSKAKAIELARARALTPVINTGHWAVSTIVPEQRVLLDGKQELAIRSHFKALSEQVWSIYRKDYCIIKTPHNSYAKKMYKFGHKVRYKKADYKTMARNLSKLATLIDKKDNWRYYSFDNNKITDYWY